MDRRKFLTLTSAAVASGAIAQIAPRRAEAAAPAICAVAFDAFVIFDPRPVTEQAERAFPGNGRALVEVWRARQFEYSWIRLLSGSYADFWQITDEALSFAAERQELELSASTRQQLMDAYLHLPLWPDVATSLASLQEHGFRSVILSNFSPHMLNSNLAMAGLDGRFESVISTDSVRTYKPALAAYQLGLDRLRLRREQVLFAAFAGWDVAGAKRFGYRTFWVNRTQSPAEHLQADADAAGTGLGELLAYVCSLNRRSST